jgi:hypothetical protein
MAGEVNQPRTEDSPRRHKLWALVVLIAIVIAAAVGGGIGGALAVQNAKLVLLMDMTTHNH